MNLATTLSNDNHNHVDQSTSANGAPVTRTGGLIALATDDEINKRACGRIVMWSLSGDVTVDALTAALKRVDSPAIPPEEPSAQVALNRAVASVARTMGHLDVHHKARGSWAIVSKPTEVEGPTGKTLVYPIACEARIEKVGDTDNLIVEGQGADQIRAAYDYAKTVLAPADIGGWLCDKLNALKALPLRQHGGVYFLPQPVVGRWEKIVAALKACSEHSVHTIPSMRSADAVEAILSALTEDTQAALTKIEADLDDGTLKARALKNREEETRKLVERVQAYEGLLGTKLDTLHTLIETTRAAVAAAALASSSAAE